MIKTMLDPVKGTFDACREVVEIDWTPTPEAIEENPNAELKMEEERTDQGVIAFHVPASAHSRACVQLDRVFDNDAPESLTIPYHSISEIRTTSPEVIHYADGGSVERSHVVWTRAGDTLAEAERRANPLVVVNSLATKVTFSEGPPELGQPKELELGPFSQGVAIEDDTLKDVASGEQIAEIFRETMDDKLGNMLGHPGEGKWMIPRAGWPDDSEEFLDTIKVYDRCFVQPYLQQEEE